MKRRRCAFLFAPTRPLAHGHHPLVAAWLPQVDNPAAFVAGLDDTASGAIVMASLRACAPTTTSLDGLDSLAG